MNTEGRGTQFSPKTHFDIILYVVLFDIMDTSQKTNQILLSRRCYLADLEKNKKTNLERDTQNHALRYRLHTETQMQPLKQEVCVVITFRRINNVSENTNLGVPAQSVSSIAGV